MYRHRRDFHSKLRALGRALIFLGGAFALQQSASAAFIYDTFTAPDNTPLIGRLPAPDDTPGSAYAGNGNVSLAGGPTGGTPYEADIQSNVARVGADAGLALNLGISTPAQFTLTISFNISESTVTQANDPRRGAALGFFSSVALGTGGSFHGFKNFTGLAVDRAGSVRLIIAGANSGIATTVAGFDPAVFHTLSYSVDTTAGIGSISNILLDGSSVSLSAPVDTFTIARTSMAGFYNSDLDGTTVASFDNFSVAVVPEPSTAVAVFALLALIGISKLRSRIAGTWSLTQRSPVTQRASVRPGFPRITTVLSQ
jgi:hypothetical protein